MGPGDHLQWGEPVAKYLVLAALGMWSLVQTLVCTLVTWLIHWSSTPVSFFCNKENVKFSQLKINFVRDELSEIIIFLIFTRGIYCALRLSIWPRIWCNFLLLSVSLFIFPPKFFFRSGHFPASHHRHSVLHNINVCYPQTDFFFMWGGNVLSVDL